MKITSCIVLGACGYLGMHLSHYLHQKGVKVMAFDTIVKNIPGIECEKIDITSAKDLSQVNWDVDAVFHFAGLTGTHAGFDKYDEYIKINEIGLLNVLTAIKNSGHKPRFVLPSTRLVYKGSDNPLHEDAPKEAKTVYAANKIAGELLLEAYRNAFGLDYTVFRICVPYGNMLGGSYSYGTIGFFINQCRDAGVVRLYGDGSLRRTFTHVEDLCRQIHTVTLKDSSRNLILNTAGECFSLKEVAVIVAQKYNAKVEFTPWPEKDLAIESGHTVFESSMLESLMQNALTRQFFLWINEVK